MERFWCVAVSRNIGGQPRNSIARLDATTGLADSWDPDANGNGVYSMAVQADGKILVGGDFTHIGGQTRNRIARLDGVTGLADSFDPNANNFVYAVAMQADGKILAAGVFTADQHRRSDAQLFCPFEQRHRRAARSCCDANHGYLDARRFQSAIHARYL